MNSALNALERLREGNLRFASNMGNRAVSESPSRRAELVQEQQPFAIILGCSDSRVPAEQFGTRLVVVMGHSGCGAIKATIDQLQQPESPQSRNLRSIVDRVRPSVEALLQTELRHDPKALARHAVRANVAASADHLRRGSEVLEQLIRQEGLLVVGAEYSLETGVVDFFDSPESTAQSEG